jgi:hypothetical protein
MTLSEYVEYLFGICTAWLGWSPADSWASTIPEIRVAFKAKVEFQKMLNGVEDPQERIKQSLRKMGK